MEFRRILVTNDDGINAVGMNRLAHALADFAEIYVVAPELERSAMGHAITMHKPLHATTADLGDGVHAWRINGTPADCAKLGVEALLPQRPDLLLSGINHGSNLGRDIYYSGTVSAAMEGMFLGVPSLALSYEGSDDPGLTWTAQFIRRWIASADFPLPRRGILYNVNFPNLSRGIPQRLAWVKLGRREYSNDFHRRVDPRGREYFWMAGRPVEGDLENGTDISALNSGCVTLTPLQMDATDYELIKDNAEIDLGAY